MYSPITVTASSNASTDSCNNLYIHLTATALTAIYTLSLHDALPISLLLSGKTIVIDLGHGGPDGGAQGIDKTQEKDIDRKSTRLNSSHVAISYAVFCLKKKT